MPRNQDVLVQITKIDAFLEKSGIREFCLACIRGPKGGCCQGCSNLGPNGCVDKPLSCAFWTCHEVDKQFPKAVEGLRLESQKWPYEITHSMRMRSIDAEAELLKETKYAVPGAYRG